ncbi:hypothetical protein [Paraburkholderia diazotrophica]|uniref:hypothetical protein n=1 Tax=Paraburkholderia diazotrophica TaxID=667676 RepID=UPI00115FC298|nr:hypothetical protein [Paraburkholderia diazotrophica]
MLDNDFDLVRGLAAIGLANTVGSDIPTIKFFARFMGLDEDIIERTIDEASQRYGIQLLLLESGNAIALV